MSARALVALLVAAGIAAPRPLAAASPEAEGLLQRAEFQQARGRDDLARQELAKLFRLEPDNPEGLAMQGRMQLRANQEREAADTLERLRRAHPSHPGVAQLTALLRIHGPDKERLRQARQLARVGRNDEAVRAFRAIFPDGFPDDDLALEHAYAVAGSTGGWEAGRALLADLARRHPEDARYQVALHAHLSTRKPVAPETLKALRELSANPAVLVARQARDAWRRAVLAMDPVEQSLPALREYIAGNPGETAVQERLDEVTKAIERERQARNDPGLRAKREGWAAIEAGRNDEAGARLEQAVALRPRDAEAVGGLGLVRLRQGRHPEALRLFEQAEALDRAGAARWSGLARTARYWALLGEARAAREAGRLDVAEARVREARTLDPREGNAAVELARIHVAAGRDREAEALLAELDAGQRAQVGAAIDGLRASRLREQAKALESQGRHAEAIAALEQGAALDPLDPWVRHDLARLYAASGDAARGLALFEALLQRRPDAEARYAYALFLSGAARESQALEVLEAVPAAERTPNMTRLQRRLWVSVQGERATAFAERGETREADAAIAEMERAAGSDRELAIEVARVLDRMERDTELRAWLDRVATLGPPEPDERQSLDAIERGLAERRARALARAGRGHEAAETYREMLRARPGDAGARLALIETLVEQGDLAEAEALVRAALEERPGDARALAAASRIAERAGRLDEAVELEQRSLAAASGSGDGWRYRRLAEMLDRQLGWYGFAVDGLYRSGTPGKSRISAEELPAAYRGPWSPTGQWLLRVSPARVRSGQLDLGDTYEASTFGSLLLCLPLCADAPLAAEEKGVALGAGLERGNLRVDVGTTPIGFPVVNAVGGLLYKGDLGPASYSIDVSRRALTSSLLSYAGARDPNTGRTWGGVVTTGARLNLSRDSGGEYGVWGLAGLYRLTGRNVQDNDKAELMAGGYRRLVNEENRQLTVGMTGMLWHFSENAGEFTFGHGGYYSPKSYRSLSLPVAYAQRTAVDSFFVRASVSVAWSESRRAPFFPTDGDLQAQAEALAPTTGIDPFYAGGSNGRSYGRSLAAAWERQVAPSVFVGARMDLERSTNYTPSRVLLYVRFSPDGPAARPVSLPPEPVLFGFQY